MPPTLGDLQARLLFSKQLAKEAGALVAQAHRAREHRVSSKNAAGTDLVTQTDLQAEQLIRLRVSEAYPQDGFVGEEGCGEGEAIPKAGGCWVVDPIDGTTNFVHGQVPVAVSIGWCWEGVPMVGVIYNPILDYLFTAATGLGAHLNEQPIQVSTCRDLHAALLHTELGVQMAAVSRRLAQMERLIRHPVHAIRMHGSAAMGMAWVAMGAAEAYFERGIKAWDICAGTVIVREAGGHVGPYEEIPEEGEFEIAGGQVMACCNQELRQQLLEVLQ